MSLARILEPEIMDSPAEAEDYNAMDHSQVNRVFVADLLSAIPVPGYILDLGTGTALIPVELCAAQSSCRILAGDAANNMLRLAQRNIATASLAARIETHRIDAK